MSNIPFTGSIPSINQLTLRDNLWRLSLTELPKLVRLLDLDFKPIMSLRITYSTKPPFYFVPSLSDPAPNSASLPTHGEEAVSVSRE